MINGQCCFEYIVRNNDSLRGLSLRYNVKKDRLKKLNGLFHDSELYSRYSVYIPYKEGTKPEITPTTKEERRREAISQFKNRYKITKEEAKYYLSSSQWDIEKAASMRMADLQFDTAHCIPRSTKM